MCKVRWPLLMACLLLVTGCSSIVTPAGSLHAPVRPPKWEGFAGGTESREPGGLLTQTELAGELARELERIYPGGTAVNHGGEAVELWNGKVPGVSVPVGPVYQAYRRQADRRMDVIRDAAQQAMAVYSAAATWEAARDHVLPQLVSLESYRQLDETGALPVYIQMSSDVFLVFDLRVGGMTALVHQGLQVSWMQTSTEIYYQALDNLERITPDLVQGEDGVWRFPVADGYEAVRVLLLARLVALDAKVPGALVIAIPTQNRLYAFDSADAAVVEAMRSRSAAEFEGSQLSLTPTWLTIQEGRLTLYTRNEEQG